MFSIKQSQLIQKIVSRGWQLHSNIFASFFFVSSSQRKNVLGISSRSFYDKTEKIWPKVRLLLSIHCLVTQLWQREKNCEVKIMEKLKYSLFVYLPHRWYGNACWEKLFWTLISFWIDKCGFVRMIFAWNAW